MKLALACTLAALWALCFAVQVPLDPDLDAPAGTGTDDEDCERTLLSAEIRFVAFDVYVDAGDQLLAAWQVEVVDERNLAALVGVEGGEHPAYAQAPHHDPRALLGGRIVIAAYQLEGPLPSGRSRVARLHFQLSGRDAPRFRVQLVAAATPQERRIAGTAEIVEH